MDYYIGKAGPSGANVGFLVNLPSTISRASKVPMSTEILTAIRQLQPGFLSRSQSLKATTHLEFPRLWGLGTSSTLIATLAQWAGVDPYQLLEKTFGGSGYDLACANAEGPIFYHREAGKPVVQGIDFSPAFSDQLYFVFLEQKQNSRKGIARYRQQQNPAPLEAISQLSKAIAKSETLSEFSKLLEKHEALVSDFIRIAPVKKRLFPDFWGSVKSLGAWGGDFVLVTSEYSEEETRNYYNEKGYPVFLKYADLILKSH